MSPGKGGCVGSRYHRGQCFPRYGFPRVPEIIWDAPQDYWQLSLVHFRLCI